MASVKSFRIADLLVGQNESRPIKPPEKPENNASARANIKSNVDARSGEKSASESAESSRNSSPILEKRIMGVVDARKVASSASSSPLSTSDDGGDKSPALEEHRPLSLKFDPSGTNLPGSMYHYPGFPIVFPLSAIPSGTTGGGASSSSLTDNESTNKMYSQGMVPYSVDAFRQNRLLMERHQRSMAPMVLPSLPGMPHGANLPQGMDYPLYPNLHGLYGIPLSGGMSGLLEKGAMMGDRDNYPMFHLGRSMYAVSCKRKGGQIRFTNSQTVLLEKAFLQQKYLNANDRKKLAHSLGLSDRQVKTWFQNRRAKLRKCKGGAFAGSDTSGSPKDSRALSPKIEALNFQKLHETIIAPK